MSPRIRCRRSCRAAHPSASRCRQTRRSVTGHCRQSRHDRVRSSARLQAQLGENPTASDERWRCCCAGRQARRRRGGALRPGATGALFLEGGVRYEDPGTQIRSDSAEFAYGTGRIRFEGASFSLGSSNGARRGRRCWKSTRMARCLSTAWNTRPVRPDPRTGCCRASPSSSTRNKGVGTAKGIKLQFQGVPILYAPYISFPIGDARKSGVLTPEIGSVGSQRQRDPCALLLEHRTELRCDHHASPADEPRPPAGNAVSLPDRSATSGGITADYLPDDSIVDDSRHQIRFDHRTAVEQRLAQSSSISARSRTASISKTWVAA